MNIPEYAVFLGIDSDGYPVLLDTRRKRGYLFIGGTDFDMIEEATKSLESLVEFVRITESDLESDCGWQKMVALGAWIQAGRAENHVLIVDSIASVERLCMTHKRKFVSLFDRITILASLNDGRKSVLSV